jgi:hypothetical protein
MAKKIKRHQALFIEKIYLEARGKESQRSKRSIAATTQPELHQRTVGLKTSGSQHTTLRGHPALA